MPHILICGPNGAGKSTLGRFLSPLLRYPFLDVEDYYFPKTDPDNPYKLQRDTSEVHALLLADVRKTENAIIASVRGNLGSKTLSLLTHIVCITLSKEESLRRVRQRSYDRFGDRSLPGGDLYEREEAFFELVKKRPTNLTQQWLKTISLPILYINGLAPVETNAQAVLKFLNATADRRQS